MALLQAECQESSEDQTFTPKLPTNFIFINAQFKFTWAADKDGADREEEKEVVVEGSNDSTNAVRVENVGIYINRYALLGTEIIPEVMKFILLSTFGIPCEHVTPIMDLILSCGRWLAGKENPPKIICMKLKANYHLESSTAVDAVKEALSKFLLHREMTSIKIPDNVIEDRAITSCGICLEDIGAGTLATRMACLHFFHHRCISAWLAKSATCPMCRHPGKRIAIVIGDDLIAYLG